MEYIALTIQILVQPNAHYFRETIQSCL